MNSRACRSTTAPPAICPRVLGGLRQGHAGRSQRHDPHASAPIPADRPQRQSTITVVGRKPDGNPLNPGTEIRLSADLGTIDPHRGDRTAADVATATFRATGVRDPPRSRPRPAPAPPMAETTMQVGEATGGAGRRSRRASPSTIPVEGTATVTVIARNADGHASAAGQTVILTTSLGTLSPIAGRPPARTAPATSTPSGQPRRDALRSRPSSASSAAADDDGDHPRCRDRHQRPGEPGLEFRGRAARSTLTAFVTNSQGQPPAGRARSRSSQRPGNLEPTGVVFTDSDGVATNHAHRWKTRPARRHQRDRRVRCTALRSGDRHLITATTTIEGQLTGLVALPRGSKG